MNPLEVITRAAAKAAGKSRYFSGKPCCNNHIAERMVSNYSCTACNSEWQLRHRQDHIEAEQKRGRDYYNRNRAAVLARHKKRHKEKHPGRVNTKKARASTPVSGSKLPALQSRQPTMCEARMGPPRPPRPPSGMNMHDRMAALAARMEAKRVEAAGVAEERSSLRYAEDATDEAYG
jgi:hypothetical protein